MSIKRLKYYLLMFGFLVIGRLISYGQNPVTVQTSSRKILIGDQVDVFLKFRQKGKTAKIQWPVFPDTIPGLVWVSRGKVDTVANKDSLILKQKLVVTGFDSGAFYIPSFSFEIQNSGQSQQIHTDSLLVQVNTISVDTAKAFKPIKDVREESIGILDYWKQILIGVLILGLIVGGFLYWRNKQKNKPRKEAVVPPEKAHEKALRMLHELAQKQVWQSGDIKGYYDQLSLILRGYLQNRFGIQAMENTSEELLRTTHKMAELKPFRKQMRVILQTADLAKFARANPMPEDNENCMIAAEEIVQKTKMTTGEGGQP